jgi:predicted alpha/beta hydrolase family esterase
MKFIIFHGSYAKTNQAWYPYLKEELEHLRQEVLMPQFPVASWEEVSHNGAHVVEKVQNLSNWLQSFQDFYKKNVKKNEKLCFVGHSLGPLFILHVLEKFKIKLDSAIFIAPFYKELTTDWQIHEANKTFYKEDFNFNQLHELISTSYTLYSENDPYVPLLFAEDFAEKLHTQRILVKGAGHMSTDRNLKTFPLLLELCKTRISNLYKL